MTVVQCSAYQPREGNVVLSEQCGDTGRCQLNCIEGYLMKGKGIIECRARSGEWQGYWEGFEPRCKGRLFHCVISGVSFTLFFHGF